MAKNREYYLRAELEDFCKAATMDEMKDAYENVKEEYRNAADPTGLPTIKMMRFERELKERLLKWYVAL